MLQLIADRRTLLFIDNFEDLLDEDNRIKDNDVASFVYTLLSNTAHNTTLFITSQRAIKLPNDLMAQSHIRICEYPPKHGLQGLPEDDALSLFYALDSDNSEGIHTTGEPTLRALIKRCDANPRVLETIVGYLRNMGDLFELSDLLNDEKELTGILQNPAKALYESQPDHLKGLLEALAIYNKPVPIEALLHLLAQDANQLRKNLSQLERNYALLYNKENKTFSLRAADQHYIYQQIKDPTTQHQQAASYYRNTRKPKEDWKRLEDLQANLDEFEQLVKVQDYDAACDVLTGIDFDYLLLWGYVREMRDLHLQLLNKVQDKKLKRIQLGNLGNTYYSLGEVRKAIEYYEKALEITREIQDRRGEGNWLGNLGNAYSDLGEVRKAIEYYEQALVINREIQNPLGEAIQLFNLALVNDDLKSKFACMVPAWFLFATIGSPYQQNVLNALKHYQTKQADFETILRSLFPSGDPILNAVTKQNYTFFRDAPPDLPDQILQALAELKTE